MKKILLPIFFIFITAVYANSAMLTFSFADGVISQKDGIMILSKYKMVGVIAMIAKRVNKDGHLSADDLRKAQQLGWEITSHGYRHKNFVLLSNEEAEYELSFSKKQLSGFGLAISNFNAPYGAWNDALNDLALKYYSSVAIGPNRLNNYPVKYPFILTGHAVLHTTTVQDVKDWINLAIAENKWIIIHLHKIGSDTADPGDIYWWPKENLDEIASWVQRQKIQVVTQQEGIQK